MAAFESAMRLGADGIECDLQLTRDGQVVIFHDANLRRLCGREDVVARSTYEHLKSARIGPQGTHNIPLLDEFLELVRGKIAINLELKSHPLSTGSLESKVVEAIRRHRCEEQILFSSFQPPVLWRLGRLAPDILRGYLFEKYLGLHRSIWPRLKTYSINPPLTLATDQNIRVWHEQHLPIFVWTVNQEDDIKRLLHAGVEGLITDDIQLAITIRDQIAPTP